MITCPDCGYKNEDSAVDCAGCGRNLEWAMRDASQTELDHRARPEQPTSIVEQRPEEKRRSVSCGDYTFWVGSAILGILFGLLGAVTYSYEDDAILVWFGSIPFIPVVGMVLGFGVGRLAHRRLERVFGDTLASLIVAVCVALIGASLAYAVEAIVLLDMREARFDNLRYYTVEP